MDDFVLFEHEPIPVNAQQRERTLALRYMVQVTLYMADIRIRGAWELEHSPCTHGELTTLTQSTRCGDYIHMYM